MAARRADPAAGRCGGGRDARPGGRGRSRAPGPRDPLRAADLRRRPRPTWATRPGPYDSLRDVGPGSRAASAVLPERPIPLPPARAWRESRAQAVCAGKATGAPASLHPLRSREFLTEPIPAVAGAGPSAEGAYKGISGKGT